MTLVKIKQHHQITLPQKMRSRFNVSVGDYIEIEESKRGFLIKPVKVISPDQEYFYTKEWQKNEREASDDVVKNNLTGPFVNAEDLIKDLEN
jgi:antitoxin MazE